MATKRDGIAIVTGAGSGIGRATAKRLARAGWRVGGVGRTLDKLQSTAEQSGCAERVHIIAADLTEPGACDRVVAETISRFGGLDALAHVAGFAAIRSIPETDDDLWRRSIDGNATSAMRLTRACWGEFERRGGGVIVNVSSMASIDPFPGFAAYAAAKAALNMFTLVTAREGASIGIRAVTVAPGAVETPMLRAMFDCEAIPPSRTLSPDDVAEVIEACVTGERCFEPGEVIEVVPRR